jgi:cytosine/adenosine deaminase-related metal-dependent hydrolase
MRISGNIFVGSKLRKGSVSISEDGMAFSEEISSSGITGTLIPTFVNAHTHIGDFFIDNVPEGGIPEIVGPGGFKLKALKSAPDDKIISGMKSAQRIMKVTGTSAFLDFRESGVNGIDLLKASRLDGIKALALGRPVNGDKDLPEVLSRSVGLGFSSISDDEIRHMKSAAEMVRKNSKIFAMHFSENKREDANKLKELKPDLLVHCLETKDSDLEIIKEIKAPIVITPRSNIFYGKRVDYSRFLKHGIPLMLGTDNGMVNAPDMFQEMHTLFLYQRSIGYFEPEKLLEMSTSEPRDFLKKFNIAIPERYILFPNQRLTAYEIIEKGSYMKKKIIKIM